MKAFTRCIIVLVSLTLLLYTTFPFFWLLLSSIKYPVELYSIPPRFFPQRPTLNGYVAVLRDSEFLRSLLNTMIISLAATSIALAIGVLSAYAITRLRFRGKRTLFLSFFITQFIPPIVVLIPLYLIMQKFKLLGSFQGVIATQLTFLMPYVIWLLYGYFVRFPYELEEAALVDGCTRFQALTKVILPLSAPGLVSTSIFAFVASWNDFLYALVIGMGHIKTISVKLAEYIGEARIVYELMFPGAIIGTLPVILVALVFQRYIIQGLAEGALRG